VAALITYPVVDRFYWISVVIVMPLKLSGLYLVIQNINISLVVEVTLTLMVSVGL
jgi:hypothetical protein